VSRPQALPVACGLFLSVSRRSLTLRSLGTTRYNRGVSRVLLLISFLAPLLLAEADLILHNGKIITVDEQFSIAQAVAVNKGRIVSVGSDAQVLAHRVPRTIVIDLRGKSVLPGLFDSHVHPIGAGLSESRQKLPDLGSYEAVQRYVRQRAKDTPKGQWIVVPRTFPTRLAERRMPTREVLDVATEHPVMFDASYVVIANSLALKVSGITRDTPNPLGGEIVKDENGEPNGILKNAQSLLKRSAATEKFTEAERLNALEGMLKMYAAAGLTSVLDRALTPDDIALYEKLRARGPLPVRVAMTWRMPTSGPTEELVRRIREAPYRADSTDDWLRFAVFKVTLDGGMTIGTAYQRQPYGPFGKQLYGKTDPQDRGQLFISPDKLAAIMKAAHAKGWSLTAHSQGGGAVDALLDAFEAVDREAPIAASRSHVMHASFQSPEAIARMKKMGVLADVQPAWLYHDGQALEKVFGDDGMKYFMPLRSYLDAGVKFAGGSDHMIGHNKNSAVNPYNPFMGMWTAVTRVNTAGHVSHPEQRIDRKDALRAYTIWGAYLQHDEKRKGSIETGKFGDMVIIDKDFMSCPESEIRNIQPLMTIVNGKILHRVTGAE
jgi:predicted amidohydrolase YtcJ